MKRVREIRRASPCLWPCHEFAVLDNYNKPAFARVHVFCTLSRERDSVIIRTRIAADIRSKLQKLKQQSKRYTSGLSASDPVRRFHQRRVSTSGGFPSRLFLSADSYISVQNEILQRAIHSTRNRLINS